MKRNQSRVLLVAASIKLVTVGLFYACRESGPEEPPVSQLVIDSWKATLISDPDVLAASAVSRPPEAAVHIKYEHQGDPENDDPASPYICVAIDGRVIYSGRVNVAGPGEIHFEGFGKTTDLRPTPLMRAKESTSSISSTRPRMCRRKLSST